MRIAKQIVNLGINKLNINPTQGMLLSMEWNTYEGVFYIYYIEGDLEESCQTCELLLVEFGEELVVCDSYKFLNSVFNPSISYSIFAFYKIETV